MRFLPALLTCLLVGLCAPAAMAQNLSGLSKQQRAEALRFSINNGLFTLYHEVGHLLIDKMGLPVLGREEDAADNIATWMLLQKNTPDANQALEDSAKGWVLTGRHYDDAFSEQDYLAGYSPDRHRALQMVCLMVGADGAAFRPIANSYAIDPEQQQLCHFEFQQVDRSVRGLLGSGEANVRVNVRYRDPDPELELAARVFRNSGIFEEVAEEVRKGYPITDRIRFTAENCGEPNAFYDAGTSEVIFCYELMYDFMNLYAEDLRNPGERAQPGKHR